MPTKETPQGLNSWVKPATAASTTVTGNSTSEAVNMNYPRRQCSSNHQTEHLKAPLQQVVVLWVHSPHQTSRVAVAQVHIWGW
jgi:hypothetical protein